MKVFIGGSRIAGEPPEGVIRAVIEQCIPSEAMRMAAIDGIGWERLGDIVRGAPIPLTEKLELFEALSECENLLHDALDPAIAHKDSKLSVDSAAQLADIEHEQSFVQQAADITRALDNLVLNPDEVFALSEKQFDEVPGFDCINSFALFSSYGEVDAYLRNNWEYWRDEDITWWYELEKWVREDSGKMRITWIYWLLYDGTSGFEPAYFEELASKRGDAPVQIVTRRYSTGLADLDLHTPFSTGDLIEVDLRPFGPLLHALVVEPELESCDDRCCPQVLFRCCSGCWDVTALNNLSMKAFRRCRTRPFSPLYRVRLIDESELESSETPLLEVRAALGGNPKRGAAFWNACYEYSACNADKRGYMDDAGLAVLAATVGKAR